MSLELLLNDYVKRESKEEKKFINEQKQCSVKLVISVSRTDCLSTNECPDLLMVHAKITQNSERKDSFFFINSMKISHCTGVVPISSDDNNKIMSIEIAITKDRSQCETIFKAFVNRDQKGKWNKFQMSYTRQIVRCHHSKEHKFEKDDYRTIFSDNENDYSENCLNTNLSVTTKPDSLQIPFRETKKKKIPKKLRKKENSDIKKNKLFPGPLRKSKLSPLENLYSKIELPKVVTPVLGTRKMSFTRIFSAEDENLERKKPTNILAKIRVNEKKEKFEFIEDDMAFIDEENDGDNTDVLASENSGGFFVRFYFSIVTDVNQEINDTAETAECTCNERKIAAMSDYILHLTDKKKSPLVVNNEIDKFDNSCGHFLDCRKLSSNDSSAYLKRVRLNKPVSFPFYSYSEPMRNVSDNLLSEFELSELRNNNFSGSVEHVDKYLEELKTVENVCCSLKHVNCFKNAKTYEMYETTMRKILANTASFDNFVVFLYSIRVIIQQIDHPCNSKNEEIQKIFKFSKQFINDFFGSEVRKRGGLDNFIFRRDDID